MIFECSCGGWSRRANRRRQSRYNLERCRGRDERLRVVRVAHDQRQRTRRQRRRSHLSHVTPTTTTTAEPYQSISYKYPYRAADGSVVTITAVVAPIPAKGDLVLQRKSGSNWVNAGVLSYSLHAKKWTIELRWKFPKHATESFRLLAIAAPGLSATHSGSFKISKLP